MPQASRPTVHIMSGLRPSAASYVGLAGPRLSFGPRTCRRAFHFAPVRGIGTTRVLTIIEAGEPSQSHLLRLAMSDRNLQLLTHQTGLSPLAERRKRKRDDEVRRRPGRTQGQALEILGHAIEYLVDSSMASRLSASPSTAEAVELLAEKSRAVFAECAAVPSLSQRLYRFLPRFLMPRPVNDRSA